MSASTEAWECVPLSGSGGPFAIRMPYPDPSKNATYYGIQGIGAVKVARMVAAAPDLLEALEAAYTFISQPQAMHTPAGGPNTATYRVEGYNALTAKLRAAIAKAAGQ